MTTWITTLGTDPFAAINTLWAALHQGQATRLQRLVVLQTDVTLLHVQTFTTWAEQIFDVYVDSQPRRKIVDVPNDDFLAYRQALKKSVHNASGNVIIDMTSGRKAMSAISLVVGELFPGKVEKVLYSILTDELYGNLPYPVIPLHALRLFNMVEKQ